MRNKDAPHGSKQKRYLLSKDNRRDRGTSHRVIKKPKCAQDKSHPSQKRRLGNHFGIDKGMRSEMWRELGDSEFPVSR